jgi:hypothetical protein
LYRWLTFLLFVVPHNFDLSIITCSIWIAYNGTRKGLEIVLGLFLPPNLKVVMIHHPHVFLVPIGKDQIPLSNDMVHEIKNISGMNQQKHVRNRQNNGEFLVSTYVYFCIHGDVLMWSCQLLPNHSWYGVSPLYGSHPLAHHLHQKSSNVVMSGCSSAFQSSVDCFQIWRTCWEKIDTDVPIKSWFFHGYVWGICVLLNVKNSVSSIFPLTLTIISKENIHFY